jgi:hypothetical protein
MNIHTISVRTLITGWGTFSNPEFSATTYLPPHYILQHYFKTGMIQVRILWLENQTNRKFFKNLFMMLPVHFFIIPSVLPKRNLRQQMIHYVLGKARIRVLVLCIFY